MKQMSRNKKNSKFWGWLVLFLGLVLVWSLSKGLWEIREGYKRIDEAGEILRQEKERKDNLELEHDVVRNNEYIERIIRDDLNMQKTGETVVILPDNEPFGLEDIKKQEEEDEKKWLKWWNLIN